MTFLSKNILLIFFASMLSLFSANASYDIGSLNNLRINVFSADETSQQNMQFGIYDYAIEGNTLTLHNPYLKYQIGGNSSELILIPFHASNDIASKLCRVMGFREGRALINELGPGNGESKFEHDEVYVSNQGFFQLKRISSYKRNLIVSCTGLR